MTVKHFSWAEKKNCWVSTTKPGTLKNLWIEKGFFLYFAWPLPVKLLRVFPVLQRHVCIIVYLMSVEHLGSPVYVTFTIDPN